MADKTLNDVVEELRRSNKKTEETNEAVDQLVHVTGDFVKTIKDQLARDKLNDEEDRRERNRPGNRNGLLGRNTDFFKAGLQAGAGFSIISLLNPARLVKLIFGGAIAGFGGYIGLRGWETGFVKAFIERFFTNLGLTPDGKIPKGLFQGPNLIGRIVNAFSRLENRILSFFGVSVSGVMARDALGRFTGMTNGRPTVVYRITQAIGRLLSPLTFVARAINDWIIGPGAKLVGFVGGATGLASVGKLASKILWPIGLLLSGWEGVKKWRDSEETNKLYRFVDGIGAFLGDFIGAPLNLLKNIVSAGLEWVGLQSASDWLDKFSFRELIGNFISSIIRIPERIFSYAKDFMEKYDILGLIGTKWKNSIEWLSNAWTNMSNYVNETGDTITGFFQNAIDNVKLGFMRISNFIKNIPDRLISTITSILDFEIPKLSIPYDNALLGKGEIVLFPGGRPFGDEAAAGERARERIISRNRELDDSISRLNNQIADNLAQFERSRQERRGQNPAPVVISAPTTNSSQQLNQTNITAFPSPFNEYAPQ